MHLSLAEFSYINNYHSSVEYVSCEKLYGMFCGQRLEQAN